ncbi:MAG: sigma-70 family RNA polymerase sigma factor [Acidobacteria bacterium]|nr:sigma-70 family RNA polymerase sigma factor [Acidobacteriota bacterium]
MTENGLKALLAVLSDDPERAGELFVHLQGKLIRYFGWNLCSNVEELADEVLDRVARRAADGEKIASPVSYVLGVARRVLLESRPRLMTMRIGDDVEAQPHEADSVEFVALDECLEAIPPESRALLLEYYSAEARERIRVRQEMADRMGLSGNALRNRCLRLRKNLQECMERRARVRAGRKGK